MHGPACHIARPSSVSVGLHSLLLQFSGVTRVLSSLYGRIRISSNAELSSLELETPFRNHGNTLHNVASYIFSSSPAYLTKTPVTICANGAGGGGDRGGVVIRCPYIAHTIIGNSNVAQTPHDIGGFIRRGFTFLLYVGTHPPVASSNHANFWRRAVKSNPQSQSSGDDVTARPIVPLGAMIGDRPSSSRLRRGIV